MNRTSYDFLDVLKGTIDDKVSTLDQTIYCKIVGVNEDYTLDVTIVPDEHTRVRNVVNASKYEFKMGDYGILYKIGNNLANAFIIAKLGPSYADNQPLSKQVADENVGNNNSEGTVVNNYYQITQTASSKNYSTKVVQTITGDGSKTSFDVAHTLGTDVSVQVYLKNQTVGADTVDELVMVDTYTLNNKVKLLFATAPTTTQTFKVVIVG